MLNDSECLKLAQENLKNAYAPYSNFKVSALVIGKSGEIYLGTNVENASYGLTMCAERVAIGSAISAGEQEIIKVYILTDTNTITTPCGACRQVIREFGKNSSIVMGTVSGKKEMTTLAKLLPKSFGPEKLDKK